MKRIYTFIMLLSFGSITFIGCGAGKNATKDTGGSLGTTVIKTVATAVGLILLSKLLKSVLNTVTGSKSFSSLTQNPDFATNFNENTKLSSFAKSDLLKTGLQVLVAEHYKIPLTTVANNYSSLTTVGDLATFIGKNADAKILTQINK